MKEALLTFLMGFFGVVVIVLLMFNVGGALLGVLNAVSNIDCGPKKNIEYVIPAYRLGCWLGEDAK